MKRISIRFSDGLLQTLDDFAKLRGLNDRSEAARLAIREAVMEPADRQTVPDRVELLRLLGDSARSGSVTAMKALLDEQRRQAEDAPVQDDPLAELDELALRRSESVRATG